MNKQAVIRALEQAHEWVRSRKGTRSTAGEPWQAENIMVGCVQVINQTGQSIQGWLSRRNRRRLLSDIRNRYLVADGNKALRDLIKLAIAAVGACSTVDDYWLGALPVQSEPRRLSEAPKRAVEASKARARAERQKSEEKLRKARFEYAAAQNTAQQTRQKRPVFSREKGGEIESGGSWTKTGISSRGLVGVREDVTGRGRSDLTTGRHGRDPSTRLADCN